MTLLSRAPRRLSVLLLLFGVGGAAPAAPAAAAPTTAAVPAAKTPRPNIVLLLADDLGFSDLGCYGSEIRTPHLDRLAADGLRFTQFYNNARCCPTRAALLTGVYPHQAGVGFMVETSGKPLPDLGWPAYRGELADRVVTIAEALRPSGYRTAMSGKWHLTPITDSRKNWPRQRGFEKFYGIIDAAASFYDPGSLARDDAFIRPEGANYFLTDAIADNAVQFIRDFAGQPQPFFLYVAFNAPHWPLHAPAEDIARYADTYRVGWDAIRAARHAKQIELGLLPRDWPLAPRERNVPAWADAPDKDWQAHRMAVYAAQVDRLDRAIGKILAQIDAAGAADNTLVLFLSDNGGCAENLGAVMRGSYVPSAAPDGGRMRTGNSPTISPGGPDTYASYGPPWANVSNTPFRLFKHWVHEGGIATPLIARWPAGKLKPGLTPEVGHIIDVMATCLDVAGAPYPTTAAGGDIVPLQGRSLLPTLRGESNRPARRLFWEHEGNRAVRDGHWKLVARRDTAWELYNLETDRTELHNLAAENPAKVADLSAAYDAWAQQVGVVPWADFQRALAAKTAAK